MSNPGTRAIEAKDWSVYMAAHENDDACDIYQKIVLMGERPQSWNTLKRMHWSTWQREVDRCKWLILAAIGHQPEPLAQPVDLIFTTFYKTKPLDTSNFPEKLYEDGLVAAGLLVDDNRQYVHDITKRRAEIDKKSPRVEIEIVGRA